MFSNRDTIKEKVYNQSEEPICHDKSDHMEVKADYMLPPANIYVISGFSGVGKGVICQVLKNRQIDGKDVALIQSYTSRPQRSENDPYTFVTSDEFSDMVQANKFLEFNSDYAQGGYGTPIDAVREAIERNKAVLLEIDRTGLMHLLTDGKVRPDLVRSVFLVADAVDVATRLYLRGTETQSKIQRRLATGIQESYYLDLYDAVIVNEEIDDTVEAVIEAFEGKHRENTFDPVKFRADMDEVLTTYWRTPDGLMYDPVEDTSEYHEAIVSIHKQLAKEFPADILEAHYCPEVWQRKQMLLKAQGIHWRTPEEMNPQHSFK